LRDNLQSVHATAAQQPCNSPRNIPQATHEILAVSFQPSHSKIMNTPTTPQPTPDLESLRKAIQEFRPNPHRVPFNNLKPFHDSIVELHRKRASYATIADLLQQHGVKTSRARVAEYGRIVLDGGKSRKRRKRAKIAPAANTPVTPASVPAVPTKPVPASTAPASDVPPPPAANSSYQSRGPRIARIRMLDGTIAGEKAPARRRKDFPAVTNACAAASARSSRRPRGFRLALAATLRRAALLMSFRASPAAFRR
jgi:hypothetical protein